MTDLSVLLATLPIECQHISLHELPPARLAEVLGFVNPVMAAHFFLMLGPTEQSDTRQWMDEEVARNLEDGIHQLRMRRWTSAIAHSRTKPQADRSTLVANLVEQAKKVDQDSLVSPAHTF